MNKRHDRAEVLNSGTELIWTKGYNNLGIDEICRTTGMTKGAFYNAFKSKENFLLEGIASYSDSTVAYLTRKLTDENKKAIDRLRGLYDDFLSNQPECDYRGCLVNNMMSEMGSINELVGTASASAFDRFVSTIEPCVNEAQQDGDLSSTIESSKFALLLHASFFGILTISKSQQDYSKGKETIDLLFTTLTPNQIQN